MVSIAELLQEQGRQAAEGQLRSGQIRANKYANLAGIAQGAIQDIGQYQRDAPKREMQTLALDEARQQADAPARALQRDAAFAKLITTNPDPSPDAIIQIYGPKDGADIARSLQAYKELKSKAVTDARETAGRLAFGFQKFTPELQQHLWPSIREAAISGGLGDEKTIPATPDPTFLDGVVRWATGKAEPTPDPKVVTSGALVDPTGKVLYQAPVAPEKVTTSPTLTPALVNGKRTFIRTKSDGTIIGMDGKPLDPSSVQQNPEKPTAGDAGLGAFTPTIATPGAAKSEDYLASLPKATAAQVKALAEGRMAFPSGIALRSDYWQNMLKAVATYDPSFDAINYNARASTRKDFTSGKSAQQVNALNTVVGHLESLTKAADELGNTSFTSWNTLANWVKDVTGKSAPKTFEATREAVADELTRVWRQAGGSEADIQERKKQLATSSSPAQFKAVIAQIGDLLESKITSMQSQYDQGMGISDIQMLTPKAKAVLDKLRGKGGAETPSGRIYYDAQGNPIKKGVG